MAGRCMHANMWRQPLPALPPLTGMHGVVHAVAMLTAHGAQCHVVSAMYVGVCLVVMCTEGEAEISSSDSTSSKLSMQFRPHLSPD